jgi:glutamine synthetase
MNPRSLPEAVAMLRDDFCFRLAFGDAFVDYFIQLKEAEIGRCLSDVTDREQRKSLALL